MIYCAIRITDRSVPLPAGIPLEISKVLYVSIVKRQSSDGPFRRLLVAVLV
jgi:hypothetical protein